MSNYARTPVRFPKMKIRGRRNRTPFKNMTWSFQKVALAFENTRIALEAFAKAAGKQVSS